MLTELKQLKSIEDPLQYHYFGLIVLKIHFSPFLNALIVSLFSYIFFLITAYFSPGSFKQIPAFLHILQINFSFTIFLGIWFGQIAFRDFRLWLLNASMLFHPTNKGFQELKAYSFQELSKKTVYLMILSPVILVEVLVFILASNLPLSPFQFSGTYLPFLYSFYLEFAFFMVTLLFGTGFWLLLVVVKAARKLSTIASVNYGLVKHATLQFLSDGVLKLCLLLLVIIASAAPSVWYVGFTFEQIPSFYYSILGGLGLIITLLTLSFFIPAYFLHRMLSIAKRERIFRLMRQLLLAEKTFDNLL